MVQLDMVQKLQPIQVLFSKVEFTAVGIRVSRWGIRPFSRMVFFPKYFFPDNHFPELFLFRTTFVTNYQLAVYF